MRRFIVAALLVPVIGVSAPTHPVNQPAACHGIAVSAPQFRTFSAEVWALGRWRRGNPPHRTIVSAHRAFQCAVGPGHRQAMKHRWHVDRRVYFAHRAEELEAQADTPYPGPNGTHWAVPWYIVSCESGGDYGEVNPTSGARGAYQFLPSTYAIYCSACDWSHADQDHAAHALYVSSGASPWVCG